MSGSVVQYGKKVQGIINLSKKKGNSKEQGPQSTGKRKEIMYCKERARVFTLGILQWFVGPLCLHYIFFSWICYVVDSLREKNTVL